MTFLMVFALLSFLSSALWLVPRILFRSSLRVPARVPQEWVDDYRAGDQ
jgi:hypothetical protein